MKFTSSLLAALLTTATLSLTITSNAFANVYAYHGINGERILTDKRIHDKQFKLVKIYKTAKKPKAKAKRPTNKYKSVLGLSTRNIAKSKSGTFRCGDKPLS